MSFLITTLAARIAGLLADSTLVRRIHEKLDTIMANQTDLDASLNQLKQVIADTADRIGRKLAVLTPTSPTFDAEVADIQADIDALKGIAPEAPVAPADAAPATQG